MTGSIMCVGVPYLGHHQCNRNIRRTVKPPVVLQYEVQKVALGLEKRRLPLALLADFGERLGFWTQGGLVLQSTETEILNHGSGDFGKFKRTHFPEMLILFMGPRPPPGTSRMSAACTVIGISNLNPSEPSRMTATYSAS